MKKILSLLLTLVLCLSCGSTAFAITPAASGEELADTVLISEKTLSLVPADKTAHSVFGQGLAARLQNASPDEYDSVINQYFAANPNPVFDSVLDVVSENQVKKDTLRLKTSSAFRADYEEVFTINDSTTLTVTPTYVVVSVLDVRDNSNVTVNATKATSSKSGTCSETYYGLVGNKLFTLTVECTFYYNGSSAWYKSGFDYYYTKGFLSIWQVSNWKGWKEASGTSYKAYCSGNFHFGLEYEGNGLVIQDFYCKNTLTCSKDGKITTAATHS